MLNNKKREIFIRIDNLSEIIKIMKEIKKKEEKLKKLFMLYDSLDVKEKEVFENWSFYLEDISEKINHFTL